MSDDGGRNVRPPPDPGVGEDESNEVEEEGTEVSTGEKIAMVVSAVFTVALFSFALWHAVTGPGAASPEVEVVDHRTGPGGAELYEIELRNPGDVGVVVATINVGCNDPPTQVVFSNVPAEGRQRGVVSCPPDTTDPDVSIASWIPE